LALSTGWFQKKSKAFWANRSKQSKRNHFNLSTKLRWVRFSAYAALFLCAGTSSHDNLLASLTTQLKPTSGLCSACLLPPTSAWSLLPYSSATLFGDFAKSSRAITNSSFRFLRCDCISSWCTSTPSCSLFAMSRSVFRSCVQTDQIWFRFGKEPKFSPSSRKGWVKWSSTTWSTSSTKGIKTNESRNRSTTLSQVTSMVPLKIYNFCATSPQTPSPRFIAFLKSLTSITKRNSLKS
jgi:hypothetical protein